MALKYTKKLQYLFEMLVSEYIKQNFPQYSALIKAYLKYLDESSTLPLFNKAINMSDNNDADKIYSELLDDYMKQEFCEFEFDSENYQLTEQDKRYFISESKYISNLKGNKKALINLIRYMNNLALKNGELIKKIGVTYKEDETWWDPTSEEYSPFTYIMSVGAPEEFITNIIRTYHPAGFRRVIMPDDTEFDETVASLLESLTGAVTATKTIQPVYNSAYVYNSDINYSQTTDVSLSFVDGLNPDLYWFGNHYAASTLYFVGDRVLFANGRVWGTCVHAGTSSIDFEVGDDNIGEQLRDGTVVWMINGHYWNDRGFFNSISKAATNKCLADEYPKQYAAGTSSYYDNEWEQNISNITVSGDTAASLEIVSDEMKLKELGLQGISKNLLVYRLNNLNGVASANVVIGGETGNTNNHTLMLFARVGTGSGSLGLSNSEGLVSFSNTSYEKIKSLDITPSVTTSKLMIVADIASDVYFVVPNLLESSTEMAPMKANSTKAATVLGYSNVDYSDKELWFKNVLSYENYEDEMYLCSIYYDDDNYFNIKYDSINSKFVLSNNYGAVSDSVNMAYVLNPNVETRIDIVLNSGVASIYVENTLLGSNNFDNIIQSGNIYINSLN